METAESVLVSLIFLIFMLLIAIMLIVCGIEVVKKPSMLSYYGVFTEEEKSSPAFEGFLKSIRAGMVAMGVIPVVGQVLAIVFGAWIFVLLWVFSFVTSFLYILYYQSRISPRMKRKSYVYGGILLLLGILFFYLVVC